MKLATSAFQHLIRNDMQSTGEPGTMAFRIDPCSIRPIEIRIRGDQDFKVLAIQVRGQQNPLIHDHEVFEKSRKILDYRLFIAIKVTQDKLVFQ